MSSRLQKCACESAHPKYHFEIIIFGLLTCLFLVNQPVCSINMSAEFAPKADGLPVVAQVESQSCYKCHGSGKHKWKVGEKCTACKGVGYIPRTRKTKKRSRAVKEFTGYLAPGPLPAVEHTEPGTIAAPSQQVLTFDGGETELCFLVGHWKIFQSTQTHRYSTDDVVTAWAAQRLRLAPGPPGTVAGAQHNIAQLTAGVKYTRDSLRILDIGCGIGSVLLMNAWCHPQAVCVGLEAQATRAAQALRSAQYNVGESSTSASADWLSAESGAAAGPAAGEQVPRISVVNGDLRDAGALPAGVKFDLITGTPPYFDPETIPQTTINETNACLSEIRGGIEVYCEAAARWLRPGGHFVVCNTTIHRERSHKAAVANGFEVLRCIDIVPRDGKPVLFMVLVCRLPCAAAVSGSSAAAPAAAATLPAPSSASTGAANPANVAQSTKRARTGSAAAPAVPKPEGYPPPAWALDPSDVPAGAAITRLAVACPGDIAHKYCLEGTIDCGDPGDDIGTCTAVPAGGDGLGNTAGCTVERICVRDAAGVRTAAYKRLLWQMGKPG